MNALWSWVRRFLGFSAFDEVAEVRRRLGHNSEAIKGAMNAFEQVVKDARR